MFTSTEWQLYQTLCRRSSPILSTSMGRLFDCVAALVGIEQKQSYEGEVAMKLEVIARQWLSNNPTAPTEHYPVVITAGHISTDEILQRVLNDLVTGVPSGEIALRFHHTLVEVIARFANTHNVKYIACSGGVFQNGLLIDLITARFQDELNVLLHDQLSCNDENIAYGQLVLCALNNTKKILTTKTSDQHVSSDTW